MQAGPQRMFLGLRQVIDEKRLEVRACISPRIGTFFFFLAGVIVLAVAEQRYGSTAIEAAGGGAHDASHDTRQLVEVFGPHQFVQVPEYRSAGKSPERFYRLEGLQNLLSPLLQGANAFSGVHGFRQTLRDVLQRAPLI